MSHVSSVRFQSTEYPTWTVTGNQYADFGYGWVHLTGVWAYTGGLFHTYDRVVSITHPGPPYRCGSSVSIGHARDGSKEIQGYGDYIVGNRKYSGGFICDGSWSNLGQVADPQRVALDEFSGAARFAASQYGAEAWRKYAPGKSMADAAVFIGELKDVPRMLRDTAWWFFRHWKGHRTRKAANAWLNTQFGWLPFLSDLSKFHYAWKNADRMIKHIRRYNNQWRRYGGSVVEKEDSVIMASSDSQTAHSPIMLTQYYLSPSDTGSFTRSKVTQTNVWCSGQFRYWIPNIDDVNWDSHVRMQLSGLHVTPALVWELTPWSWLIDWFVNVDDYLNNMTSGWASNLVAREAYCMAQRSEIIRVESQHRMHYANVTLNNTWDLSLIGKGRATMSPFGVGLSQSDLTPRQLSILAALGISRLSL